ncbi:hypothetical protein R6Q57_005922 [Mikania cordata]
MLPVSTEETASSFPTGLGCHHFPISEIQTATQYFNESLLIGEGGFGKVYKGKIKIGTKPIVAIKRLDSSSAQGATEFWAEIEMLSMLRHCNLVSLIGYCNENEEMILVYEYMPNGTLEDHLHKLRTPLSFSQRLKICIGAARGLHYLHTGTGTDQGIIHRDVKSSNILLDNNWAAKISDFGLSKINPTDKPSTYVNTLIKGTFGYFDPEYFSTGKLTRKSDVFSFGVILLEVICRKRAVDQSIDEEQWGLVGWAQDYLREGKLKEIIDPFLKGQVSVKCLNDYAKLVDGCLRTRLKLRITMAEVVFGLESILALHERTDNSFPEKGIISFGRKLQKYFFSPEQNNFGNSDMPNPWYTNPSSDLLEKLTAVGWLSWLAAVSGEALNGWLPRRINTFKNLGKAQTIKTMAMEIVTLRRLDHPNVIKLEGIVTSPRSQTLYLVFEYMDHDLATLSASNATQFTEPQMLDIFDNGRSSITCISFSVVSSTAMTIKCCIVISKDLIFYKGVLKIADFGSASFYGLIHEQPMTNFVATYWYRAPELLLGATEYGVGIDLWSAGCILAGLLANRPILAGHTEAEQLEKIYALCGSPPDEYWKTYKLPFETIYKPQLQFRRCLTETFKDFLPASLSLLDVLLSVDPAKRQNAASALKSKASFVFVS